LNENTVLYALSTLAQTCAGLAAFVGAVGLFRLQALRESRQSAEENLRSLLVVSGALNAMQSKIFTLREVLQRVEEVRANPTFRLVEEAFVVWSTLEARARRSAVTLSVFKAWNLLVILISIGAFAHVPVLTYQLWASLLLWIIAIVTAIVSGVSVFVWLELR
jgi:hypothetical protein